MKTLIILALTFLSLNLVAQSSGYEKIYTWATPDQDSCFWLDDLGKWKSVGLTFVTTDMTDGYFKLFGKSSSSPAWVLYGSGIGSNDSILISDVVAAGLRSSGWVYDTPIFNHWQVCFYKQTDDAGIIQFYQVIGDRK